MANGMLSRRIRRQPWQIDDEQQKTIPRRSTPAPASAGTRQPVRVVPRPVSVPASDRGQSASMGTTTDRGRPPSDRGLSRPAPRQIAPSLGDVDAFQQALERQYGGRSTPSTSGLGGAMSSLFSGGQGSTQYNRLYEPWLERFDTARENIAMNNAIAAGLAGGAGGAGGAGSGGGGVAAGPDYSGAINLLRDRLAGVSAQYDPMRAALASAAAASRQTIDDASAQALARLAQIDPEAAFQFAVQQTQTPAAAGMNYLQAIGASGADVDAVRALNEALLAQQLGASQQYSSGMTSALEAERAARQAASVLMQQEGLRNLEAVRLAEAQRIANAEAAARKAIEDEILAYELQQAGG